ncbi:MAG: hypothetical protein WDZ77_02295 [Candidatus Pacearchaeota archaeon]
MAILISVKVYNLQTTDFHNLIYEKFRELINKIKENKTLHSFHWLMGSDESYGNQINLHLKIEENQSQEIKDIINEILKDYKIKTSETSEKENAGDTETLGPNCKFLLSEFLHSCCKLALERTNPENKEYFSKDLTIEKFLHCFLNSQGMTYQEEIVFCTNYANAIHKMLYDSK